MRKSAAPSANNIPYKRKKFSTPFTQPLSRTKEQEQYIKDLDPNASIQSEGKKLSNMYPIQHGSYQSSGDQKSNNKKTKDERSKNNQHMTVESLQEEKSSMKKDEVKRKQKTKDMNRYFTVVWCKASNKKHKVWEGDGVVLVKCNRSATLFDDTGSIIAQASGLKGLMVSEVTEGSIFKIGAKEVEVQNEVNDGDFTSGKYFTSCTTEENDTEISKVENKAKTSQKHSTIPLRSSQYSKHSAKKKSSQPRHNPNEANALVMPHPPQPTDNVVDVVIDPYIASKLRPHQREGVQFMYECVMGHRGVGQDGVILA